MYDRRPEYEISTDIYCIQTKLEMLELKFQQLKNDIDALFEITNRIRPKYYKVDNEYLLKRNELPATPSATPGSIEPVDYFTTGP